MAYFAWSVHRRECVISWCLKSEAVIVRSNFNFSGCLIQDGLIDAADPGCWLDPNDPNSYDPLDNNEGDRTSQCQDQKDNDGDGAIDVVAVSAFNEWDKPGAASLVWFRNDGHQNFTPHVLAYEPTHLLTIAAADFDGSGRPTLVSGAFFSNAPFDHLNRLLLWPRVGSATGPQSPVVR